MKRFIALLSAVVLLICAFTACVSIENEPSDDTSISSPSASADDTTFAESSEDIGDIDVSVSQPVSQEPIYTPIYPADYDERVAYYTNMTLQADVNDVYFNDSVFVGNSIMLHYKNYVTSNRASTSLLGNASFFAAASFSLYNNKHQKPTDADCALPVYQGEKLNIKQAVEKMQVKTVYLSLMALNDIALYKDGITGVDETYKLFTELVEELHTEFPDTDIVVLSNTYLHSSSSGMKKLNNGTIQTLNVKVLDFCNDYGLDYIDVSEVLLDDENCLGTEFCSDVGSSTAACHLTNAAYNAWTEILRDYAAKKTAGNWVNPKELKPIS